MIDELSPSLFPSLHTITFKECWMPPNACFVSFLTALPHLRRLYIHHCDWDAGAPTGVIPQPSAPISLDVLEFIHGEEAPFSWQWMAAINAHGLRRLLLYPSNQQAVEDLQPFVDATQYTLRNLDLELPDTQARRESGCGPLGVSA
jgi:hypothetical protein